MRVLVSLPGLIVILFAASKIVDPPFNLCFLSTSFCALAQNSDLHTGLSGREQEAAALVEMFENYNNQKTRPGAQGPPLTIRVGLGIEGIPKISDTTGEFQIDLLVRQSWVYKDLRYNFTPSLGYITLPQDYERK